MSTDPAQEFFADGIAEDVITALSRYPSLFVIARNSSFTYKGGAGMNMAAPLAQRVGLEMVAMRVILCNGYASSFCSPQNKRVLRVGAGSSL
jgi:hypothetical protein